jgi:ribosomal protein S17E
MWYKTAKYGYVDVQKYIEEQLGYELNFKIEDYLEYMIKKSSKIVHGIMQIDFDKMNSELQNSPFNFLVKRFGSMEELTEGNREGIGVWIPSMKAMLLVPSFPASLLFKIVDVAMHEFAHALDKGAGRYPEDKYFLTHFKALAPTITKYMTQLYNDKKQLLSREQVWDIFLNLIVKDMNIPDDNKPLKEFQRTYTEALWSPKKNEILDHIFAIVSNNLTDDDSMEEFLLKEYYNLPVEAPAQLNSLYRETLPERLLESAIAAYITHIYSPSLIRKLELSPDERNPQTIFKKLQEMMPGFVNDELKEDFISYIRIEIFDDIDNSNILIDGKGFLKSIRKKHVKRQAYKILNENFAEFKKLVEAL